MAYDDQKKSSSNGILLGGRLEIFPSKPLPDLDSPGGPAFVARFRGDAASSLYAIVCDSKIPPRFESVPSMRNVDNRGVLPFVEGGVIPWKGESNAYALVYQKPTAPRMMTSLDEVRPPLGEDATNRFFIAPMIDALMTLSNMGLVHNAIRPTNIFWRIGTASIPQLGECLSSPAGFGQPVLFEPPSRARAMPFGRGVGVYADDCYAFGITLALLVLGRNPLQGLSDKEIIDLKLQKGSFGAVIGNSRLLPTHIEILRGLLADDPAQRWTPNDLEQWLGGRRMTLKSSDAGRRASRLFSFLGKEYWQIAPLAEAFASNPSEATKVIENESLNKWLRRALNGNDLAHTIEDVVNELKQSGKAAHYEDQLVAQVCIILDHSAPIRYRGLSVLPAGVPALLVNALSGGCDIQVLSEIIAGPFVSLWIHMQGEKRTDYVTLGQMFDRIRNVIEKGSIGNGIERALYESNPGLPCLSPLVRDQFVTAPKKLLEALERVAARGNQGREPMDRHIAAFLIVRERRGNSAFSSLSGPEDLLNRKMALLTVFAELQYKYGPENLPHLASWLSSVVDPALQRFFSKTLREAKKKRAKDLVAAGDLSALLQLIDNPVTIERDQKDFIAARLLYLNIQKEIIGLEAKNKNRDDIARKIGRPTAVTISSFLAVVLISAAVLRAFFSVLMR
ncbi:MAG: hypothetical protein PHS57_01320 [Alphaproteobacteria bacterium]|nr:hypothetical protein [Alphaproteobacteria bacterium]